MSLKSKVLNTFINNKSKKGGKMATSSSLPGSWLQLDDSSTLSTLSSGNSATAAMMQQQASQLQHMMQQQASQLQQLQNQQLGATYPYNSAPSPFAPTPYVPTPYTNATPYTIATPVDYPELKQILTLQVANLIANVGPLTARRILLRYKIYCEDFDVIAKELVKIMNGDDDAELDKVINDAVKEVKL